MSAPIDRGDSGVCQATGDVLARILDALRHGAGIRGRTSRLDEAGESHGIGNASDREREPIPGARRDRHRLQVCQPTDQIVALAAMSAKGRRCLAVDQRLRCRLMDDRGKHAVAVDRGVLRRKAGLERGDVAHRARSPSTRTT
jgi:hypothetical protein